MEHSVILEVFCYPLSSDGFQPEQFKLYTPARDTLIREKHDLINSSSTGGHLPLFPFFCLSACLQRLLISLCVAELALKENIKLGKKKHIFGRKVKELYALSLVYSET